MDETLWRLLYGSIKIIILSFLFKEHLTNNKQSISVGFIGTHPFLILEMIDAYHFL